MVISQRASQPVSHGSETSAEPCLRADQFEHLRDALLAELDPMRAIGPCDDDAGHAHRAILVPKLREVRNIVGLGAHGPYRPSCTRHRPPSISACRQTT